MKSKIVLMSASVLFAAGVGFHAVHYCPLQHLLHANDVKAEQRVEAKPAQLPGHTTLAVVTKSK